MYRVKLTAMLGQIFEGIRLDEAVPDLTGLHLDVHPGDVIEARPLVAACRAACAAKQVE